VTASSPISLLVIVSVFLDLIVEHFIEFLNLGTFYGQLIKIAHDWIFPHHLFSRCLIRDIFTQLKFSFSVVFVFLMNRRLCALCPRASWRHRIRLIEEAFVFGVVFIQILLARMLRVMVAAGTAHQSTDKIGLLFIIQRNKFSTHKSKKAQNYKKAKTVYFKQLSSIHLNFHNQCL